MVEGRDWFHLDPAGLVGEARPRFAADLARFLTETHAVPIQVACEWLGVPCEGERDRMRLIAERGKPGWFNSRVAAAVRRWLAASAQHDLEAVLDQVAESYTELDPSPRTWSSVTGISTAATWLFGATPMRSAWSASSTSGTPTCSTSTTISPA